jgi:uncharacterized damage-inducible protein DinB
VPSHAERYAHRLEAQAEALLRRIVLAPPGAWHRQPPDGGWSPAQVVAHICEFVPFWATRAATLATTPGATWGRQEDDPERLAGVVLGESLEPDAACGLLHRVVSDASAALRSLTDDQLAVPLRYALGDPARDSVAGLIEHALCRHLEGHHAQLRRLLSA